MSKLERLMPYAGDATALVLTAVVVSLFVLTVSVRLIDARLRAPRDRELQLSLAEEPPAATPPAPTPPLPRREPVRQKVQLAVPAVEPALASVAPDPPEEAAALSVPAPAAPAVSDPDLNAQYAAALRADIDRRTAPPDSPQYRLQHPSGEARVLFVVSRGGEPRSVTLLRSSGSALLDQAALRIVSSGHYAPMPAKAFVGEAQHTFAVAIEFRATAYHAML
jgi:TonB family protein